MQYAYRLEPPQNRAAYAVKLITKTYKEVYLTLGKVKKNMIIVQPGIQYITPINVEKLELPVPSFFCLFKCFLLLSSLLLTMSSF